MGKMKKKLRMKQSAHSAALDEHITRDAIVKKKNKQPKFRLRQDEDKKVLDANVSKQILRQVRLQQIEEAQEDNSDGEKELTTTLGNQSEAEEDFAEEEQKYNTEHHEVEVTEEDEKALEMFMSGDSKPRLTLADLIMDKISEKQTEIRTQLSNAENPANLQDIDPRIKKMYLKVKFVLSRYRSGKLPKAFKIIPKLKNWEQILYLTDPSYWSAAAMYQGTRIFASNLKENMAQRFYNLVLLPRIRDDISEYKRLNFHLYQALRKALFKPGAFMKGIVIPLCEARCTLREAVIVGSVVAKNSIPMLHSAATILKLAEMEYNGPTSIFLRTLFDKKYALPYRVIDAVVFHFLRFERDKRELPVLWHQSFLTFVERYKGDISTEQKESLLQLLRHQSHYSITPSIRRELESATCRDTEFSEKMEE